MKGMEVRCVRGGKSARGVERTRTRGVRKAPSASASRGATALALAPRARPTRPPSPAPPSPAGSRRNGAALRLAPDRAARGVPRDTPERAGAPPGAAPSHSPSPAAGGGVRFSPWCVSPARDARPLAGRPAISAAPPPPPAPPLARSLGRALAAPLSERSPTPPPFPIRSQPLRLDIKVRVAARGAARGRASLARRAPRSGGRGPPRSRAARGPIARSRPPLAEDVHAALGARQGD